MQDMDAIKDKMTAVRFTQKQYEALEALAKKEDRPVAWMIRKAVTNMLDAKK